MSPVARPPAPPTPPTHAGLRASCEIVERMCAQLELARQDDATLAVNLASMSREYERAGVMELATLPTPIRRTFETVLYVAMTRTQGEPAEARMQMARAMYATARVVAEAYELEGTGDAVPPTSSD